MKLNKTTKILLEQYEKGLVLGLISILIFGPGTGSAFALVDPPYTAPFISIDLAGDINQMNATTVVHATDGNLYNNGIMINGGTYGVKIVTSGAATLNGSAIATAGDISTEAGTRSAADTALQANIDTLSGSVVLHNNASNGILNVGSLAGVTTISASGVATIVGLDNTNGGISNAGAVSGVTTLATTGSTTLGNDTADVTTISGNANVNGLATLASLSVTNSGSIAGNLTVGVSQTIGGTLGVSGATTLSTTLNVNGNTTLGNDINDTTTLTGNLTANGTTNRIGTVGTSNNTVTGLTNAITATNTNTITATNSNGMTATTGANTLTAGTNNVLNAAAQNQLTGGTGNTVIATTGNNTITATAGSNSMIANAASQSNTIEANGNNGSNSMTATGANGVNNITANATTGINNIEAKTTNINTATNGSITNIGNTNSATTLNEYAGNGKITVANNSVYMGVDLAAAGRVQTNATTAAITAGAANAVSGVSNGLTTYNAAQTVPGSGGLDNGTIASQALVRGVTYVNRIQGDTLVDGNMYINGTLTYTAATSAQTTVVGGGSNLAGAAQATTGSTIIINKGEVSDHATADAIGKISITNTAATEGSASLTLTNGIGNTHGIAIAESKTVLSGGTHSTSMTLDDGGATYRGTNGEPVRVTGVRDGKTDYDAVNFKQMKQVYSGIASVAAMASVPAPAPGDTFSAGVGYGHFRGQNAMALGLKGRAGDHITFAGGMGYGSAGSVITPSAGMSFSW